MRRRKRNFIQSLAGFLFGWLRRSIPEIYIEGMICEKHHQFDCNICRAEWELYEVKNPEKAQRIKEYADRPAK